MTAVAGFIHHDGSVWIGGDSAGSGSHGSLQIRSDEKVFTRGNFLFGCTGSFRVMQLIRFRFRPPEHPADMDSFEYLSTGFVDALRTCLKQGGAAKEIDREEIGVDGMMVAYRGRLFRVECDYQVAEMVCRYDAVGSGGAVCLGALSATVEWTDAEARMKEVLSAAEYHCNGVEPPFNIVWQARYY